MHGLLVAVSRRRAERTEERGKAEPGGARLLDHLARSRHILSIIHLVAPVVAGIVAVIFEQWILLTVVVVLLVVSLLEEFRRRSARAPARDGARPRRG